MYDTKCMIHFVYNPETEQMRKCCFVVPGQIYKARANFRNVFVFGMVKLMLFIFRRSVERFGIFLQIILCF